MQAFKEWLRARLDDRNWSNADLERASGVDGSIIWRWLSDRPRRPSPANLKKIAGPLGVSHQHLMAMCGYLPGTEIAKSGDAETDSRLSALWGVVKDIPTVYWPAVFAAVTAVAENLPASLPVSDADTVSVSTSQDSANRADTAPEPPLRLGYHGRDPFSAPRVTGFMHGTLAVSA